MSDLDDLLIWRDKKFSDLMQRSDLEQMKADAKSLERELAKLGDEKKSVESRIGVLQDSQRRLVRFLDLLQDK